MPACYENGPAFEPECNVQYSFLFDDGKILQLTFSENNLTYRGEDFMGLDSHECFDNDNIRYIYYVDDYSEMSLSKINVDGTVDSNFGIMKIFIHTESSCDEDILLWSATNYLTKK